MPQQRARSPFDRLRLRFEETERRCRECGHVDDERAGAWQVTAGGRRVRYRRVCPTCDAVETRELRLG